MGGKTGANAGVNAEGALTGLRVLDLAGHSGALCGRLLADLGADVVKVEPPSGDPARRIGPFVDGRPGANRSLFFFFYNLNKRSVTLDLEQPSVAGLWRELLESADVLIETFSPTERERLNLAAEELHAINPSLVICSITPFGSTGPRRAWAADDLVLTALGGMLYVNGFPERPPIRPLGLQAYHSASFYAAIAILCALIARQRTGRGCWIDLSAQEATASAVEHVAGSYFSQGRIEPRRGTLHWSRYFRVARCRDGYVMHCSLGDWTSLLEWVKGETGTRALDDPQWENPLYRAEHAEEMFDVLDRWVADKSCRELLDRAQELRLPYAIVRPPGALLTDEQLAARGFFMDVEHPELGRTLRYPGAPALFTHTPARVYRRPPLLGEHTVEILHEELGHPLEELESLCIERAL